MNSEERAEDRMNDSGFVERYAGEHKVELAKLRAKVEEMGLGAKCIIIGDEAYDDKRLQYATTSFLEEDVSPRIILTASGEADIQKGIKLCQEMGMSIAVRTGGHQYCGYSSTSPINMQLDLRKTFRDYSYDPETNVLRCGVSFPLGEWAKLNDQTGIYLPMGVCAFVHLGGHVHTGGWGMVARSHGILADHVLAFDIILASGEQKHIVKPDTAKPQPENDDLYYAVLGGSKGGEFGIITHWEFRPIRNADHPNSACYTFAWLWSEDKMETVVRQLTDFSKKCADGTIPHDYEFMLTITGTGQMDILPNHIKQDLGILGELGDDLVMPPLIQMWMCYTNINGESEPFDDQWFEAFAESVGDPLSAHRMKEMPISEGLAEYFIMKHDREMEYPFVKRSRVTMDVPEQFPYVYTERMNEIMGILGTRQRLHLVSQMQIYAGGAVATNPERHLTSYSWRDQALAMSHDAFYRVGVLRGDARDEAEAWQAENDKAFIAEGGFSDTDMRMFAYTFGDRDLEVVWQHFYDSKEKYDRLRRIKAAVDPDGLFIADDFAVKPM